MSSAITSLILVGGLAFAGWFIVTQTDILQSLFKGGNPLDVLKLTPSPPSPTGSAPAGAGAGATAVSGKQIYPGTGKVLTGDLAVKEAKENWGLASGGSRPSTRFIWGSGKGKGAAKCVTFNSYEATVYATFGKGGKPAPNTRYILTGGGGGQRGNNCCVYSIGFVTSSGDAFAEEEGAHDPSPTIEKMPVTGGSIKNIGPLVGRTVGLKEILIRRPGQVLLEGWVDKGNNGNWELFYRDINPHGGKLPVITKTGLVGEQCGEVRMRCDGIWPVDIDISRSSVAELPDTVGASAAVPIPAVGKGTPPTPVPTAEAKKAPAKAPAKKKANLAFVYDGQMHYLEEQEISTLYSHY